MNLAKDRAIILKFSKFKDRDKLVWLLTEHHGKISAIAKGANSPKSKRGANIDIFNLVDAKFASKNEIESDNLVNLTDIKLSNGFSKIKSQNTFQIFYLAELILKLELDQNESRFVFNFLISLLELATHTSLAALVPTMELKLLEQLGHKPKLDFFVDTNKKIQLDDDIFLSYDIPGFQTNGEKESIIAPRTYKIIKYILESTPGAAIKLKLGKEDLKNVSKVCKTWILGAFHIKLNSLAYLNGV